LTAFSHKCLTAFSHKCLTAFSHKCLTAFSHKCFTACTHKCFTACAHKYTARVLLSIPIFTWQEHSVELEGVGGADSSLELLDDLRHDVCPVNLVAGLLTHFCVVCMHVYV
jgi:hypothetical protein